ncbi:MAG: hypothetical protein JXQ73_04095 [Phycisphaerae bacterium]|nr:hypothetical protein [Phycisphaerae bacterium]
MNRRSQIIAVGALLLAGSACLAVESKSKKKPPRRPPNPSLQPVKDVPGLPRVLLIGDSISMGYTIPTRKLLEGKANLHRIPRNGGPTIQALQYLPQTLAKDKWDVIHFNWGLHDLKRMPGGKHQVPLDEYAKNLEKLVKMLEASGAKLIWASTTPVPAGKLSPPRGNDDVIAYNAAAKKIMDAHGIPIDDLYAFALPRLERIQRPVNVHFTDEGSAALAKPVAESILKALGKSAATRPQSKVSAATDYLKVVRAYADAMLDRGRDSYGTTHSPLFASTMDRPSLTLPTGDRLKQLQGIERGDWGIRSHDRMLTGANPMHDQNLYQVLYGLTKVTGQDRYAAEADKTLKWFFEHCQSPTTGLLAWGEHIGWDFNTEKIIDKPAGTTHEFFRPWVLWQRCWTLAPEACRRFAMGLWQHQIGDPKTGNFSRHARYDTHGPGTKSEYPRHGGFYIATWAHAYKHTQDPTFAKAIETLLTYFDTRRSPKTDAIPAESNERSKGEMMWTNSNLSLAVDLWDGAAMAPPDLAKKMRQSASRTDKVFLKLPHDLAPDGKGFVKIASTHSLDIRKWGERGAYTRQWATGYGDATDAALANLCMLRYRQTKLDGYKKLVLGAATRYLTSEPEIDFPVYPGTLGDVIELMLAAHEISGESRFLDRADHFADRAIQMFLGDGAPVPKASTKHDHYEAITRGDTLMMALLELWTVRNKPDLTLALEYPER